MQRLIRLLAFCCALAAAAIGTAAAEENNNGATGARIKSDAKAVGKGVKDAAATVGHQIGTGTRNTVKSIKKKVKSDVAKGTPGDGSARRENEKNKTSKMGRN